MLHQLVGEGTTVLLTTQYLIEADELADSITMIDSGGVVAEGTPAELESRVGNSWFEICLGEPGDLERAHRVLADAGFAIWKRAADSPTNAQSAIRVALPDRRQLLALCGLLERPVVPVSDVDLGRPTLDDVFWQFTTTDHIRDSGQAAIECWLGAAASWNPM